MHSIPAKSKQFAQIPHSLINSKNHHPLADHHAGDTLWTIFRIFQAEKKWFDNEVQFSIECSYDASGNHIISDIRKINEQYFREKFRGRMKGEVKFDK